ncbi:MAG: GNAT family N-acetyltransferase [Sphingobacterium composti]
MSNPIYLRPLQIEDARKSFKWRNDAEIWTYTGFVPTQEITLDIEEKWLTNVLKNENDKRFAICLSSNDEYIGNVQLRNIIDNTAEFELFIGEKQYWGKGIGFEATRQMLQIAFNNLNLQSVYLYVHPQNIIGIRCYYRAGFKFISEDEKIKMVASTNSTAC